MNNQYREQQQPKNQRNMPQQYRDGPPNDQYYQENQPYYDEGGDFQNDRHQHNGNRGQNQRNQPGPGNYDQQLNDGAHGMGPDLNRGMQQFPNMMPSMMPLPPMPSLDPLKMQLQSQFSNFQKDIMRLQHQQKQMMRNYHKEVEMLQRKKQQIVSEMKNDQDAQMKMQIQSLSYAIQTLGEKMGRRDLGLPQSMSPQKNEIVAEVINELRNVIPIPQQSLQYNPVQFSQSLSPPPGYQIYQDDLYSDLPPQLKNQNNSFVHEQKNTLPQFINQKPPQNQDFQLPSTTFMMPHGSPRFQQQQQNSEPYYYEVPQQIEQQLQQQEAQYKVTKAKDPRQAKQQVAAPPPPPPEQTMIFNPNAPVPGNKDGIYPDISFPEIEDHTSQLKEKADQLHKNPKSIDPRSQLKTSQQPRGQTRQSRIEQPVMEEIQEEADPLGPNISIPHEISSHASKLKQKAKELQQASISSEVLQPEEAIKNIQKNLLQPFSDRLDKINEEEDESPGTLEATPAGAQKQDKPIQGSSGGRINLQQRPSISTLIRDSARNSPKLTDEKPGVIGDSAGEETPPPMVQHPASLRVKQPSKKELVVAHSQSITPRGSQDKHQQQRMSVIDQIRYRNSQQQNQVTQSVPQSNQQYPVNQQQQQIQQHQHYYQDPRKASRIDQQQRISLINRDSDPELQTLNQQVKYKKPFEMIPQKSYIPAPTPYASNQYSSNTYFISSDPSSMQKGIPPSYSPPPPYIQTKPASKVLDQAKPFDKEQVMLKSLHLVSSNLTQKSLHDALESIRKQEQINEEIKYKAGQTVNRTLNESLISIARKEDQLNRSSNQLTNQALIEALDSIRRLQSEAVIQESQQQMEELKRAQEQLIMAQQITEQRYFDMLQQQQQQSMQVAQPLRYNNKIDQRAVNEALNSIRQVQANLEARNLLSNNPPQVYRMPPYMRLQEDRQQIPIMQSRVLPQGQLSPKLETQVYSPVGDQYINLTEDEYNQEIEAQYSQNFESEQNPGMIQSQQYYVPQQQMSPKMQQEAPQTFGTRGIQEQSNDPYLVQSQQNYGSPKMPMISQNPSLMQSQSQFQGYQVAPPIVSQPLANLQVDPRLFTHNLQSQQQIPPPPTKIQPIVPDYNYDEEFVHYAKEDSDKNMTPQEGGSESQSQYGKHKNHTPPNLIIKVAPPEEEMQLGIMERQEGTHLIVNSPQKQQQLTKGAPRLEETSNGEQSPKIQSYHYNIKPQQNIAIQPQKSLQKDEEVPKQPQVQASQQQQNSKKVLYPPPWRIQTAQDADRTPLPVDVPPISDNRTIESRQTANRSIHKSHSQPIIDQPDSQADPGISIVQGPNIKKKPPQQNQDANTEKYNYQPQGILHNIEATQNILEQDVLYSQLLNYERQHMLEMQDYIQKQEELKQLEAILGENQNEKPTNELVFPDFSSFLYNKFLINGAPAPIQQDIEIQHRESPSNNNINISNSQIAEIKPIPRAEIEHQLKNSQQFQLKSQQAIPELEKPPTRLILDQIKQNHVSRSPYDTQDDSQPLRIIPHTPSLMMRPVTHAAPRPIETKEQEQEQFKTKVDEIQKMVNKYERIKKEVEYERMEQEKRQVDEFGQDYMRSLKQVESMVRDKDSERWRKKMEQSINIGSQIVNNEEGNQMRQGTSQQGFRPQFGMKNQKTPLETLPQDPRQQQISGLKNSYLPQQQPESEYKDDFQQSYNNHSDELNIADPLASSRGKSMFDKSMPRSEDNSPQHQQVLQARAQADMRGAPRVQLPQISMPSYRPMTGQSYLRDMMQQVPSINNPNAQSKTKPPLPPVNVKAPPIQYNSRNQMENSGGYLPKHFSQQSVQFPPIQRSSSFKSIEERDSEKSVIDIFNPTLGRIPNRARRNSGGNIPDFFEAEQSARRQPNGNDPFSIRDRLRQTLTETAQMMRIDNVNLLQKVKEFDRTIKPSTYDQGLPPIIDIADKAKQSAIQINNAPNQHYVEEPVDVGQYQGFDPANFPNNYQDWQSKRQVAKHKEDRYNIRGSGNGGADQSFQDNQFVKEMMQTRNQPLGKSNSTTKLQPLTQNGNPLSSSAKVLPQSLMNPKKHMLPGQLGQTMEQTIKSQPGSPSQFSNMKLSEKLNDLKQDENESHASSISRRDNGPQIQYRVVEHMVETPPRDLYGSSQVVMPTLSQSDDPRLSSGNDQPSSSNPANRNSQLSPINNGQNNVRDSLVSVSDLTERNIQVQQNIQESPEQKSARQWVSHWFKDAPQRQTPQNSPTKNTVTAKIPQTGIDLEQSVDQQSAKKYLSGIFNLGGSQQLRQSNMPKITEPISFRPTTPGNNQIFESKQVGDQEKSVDQQSAKKYLSGIIRGSK